MAKCIRCGRPVVEGVSICGVCNPANLPTPAPRQAHGSLAGILIVTAIVMGFVSVWLFGDEGSNPDIEVAGLHLAQQTPTTRIYEIEVRNTGGTPAQVFCRLVALDESGATISTGRGEVEEEISPGGTGVVEVTLETAVQPADVEPKCV